MARAPVFGKSLPLSRGDDHAVLPSSLVSAALQPDLSGDEYLPEPRMMKMINTLRLTMIGLPLMLAGCDMMGGGAPAPATAPSSGASAPLSVSGQAGGGTQSGPSGGAEGGATQAGVGLGGVTGLGAGPAAGGGTGSTGSAAANGNGAGGPGDNSAPPIAGTGGAP